MGEAGKSRWRLEEQGAPTGRRCVCGCHISLMHCVPHIRVPIVALCKPGNYSTVHEAMPIRASNLLRAAKLFGPV